MKKSLILLIVTLIIDIYCPIYALNYKFDRPKYVAVDKNQDIYVMGYKNKRYYSNIIRINEGGALVNSLGEYLCDTNISGKNEIIVAIDGEGLNIYHNNNKRNTLLMNDKYIAYFKNREKIKKYFKYLNAPISINELIARVIQPTGPLAINSKGQICAFGWGLEKVEIDVISDNPTKKDKPYKKQLYKQRIGILDPKDGHPIMVFGETGCERGKMVAGSDIDVDAQDNIYVADRFRSRVLKYDKNGNFITEWGKVGREPGQFSGIKWLAVDKNNGFVYTGEDHFVMGDWDAGMHRVQKFTTDGKYLATWGKIKRVGLGFAPFGHKEYEFYSVEGLDVDPDGNVWILSSGPDTCALRKYSPEGKEIMRFGEGLLSRNVGGITVDSNGDIWVCDSYKNRLVHFNNKGKYLGEIK